MKHLQTLFFKFIMVTLVLAAVLNYMTGLAPKEIFWLSIAITLFSYILGDLLILPFTGSTTAAFADMALNLAMLWLFDHLLFHGQITLKPALIASIILGLGELLFHQYVNKVILYKLPRI